MSANMERLVAIESECRKTMQGWIPQFSDTWEGKIRFCMCLALAVRTMVDICPGVTEANFVEDVKNGALLWAEMGFPERAA